MTVFITACKTRKLFRFTSEEYHKFVEPYDLKVLDYANDISKYNILHCCGWSGDLKTRVEVWKNYKTAVNWASLCGRYGLKCG